MGQDSWAANARLATRGLARKTLVGSEFIDKVEEIVEEYNIRKKEKSAECPFVSAEGYLKRECYILITNSNTRWHNDFIKKLSVYTNRERRQPSYEENRYYWGLLAIDPSHDMIGHNDLQIYSRQMLYAQRHGVPPEHLVGFLYQSGNQKSIQGKVQDNKREEEFDLVRNRTKHYS